VSPSHWIQPGCATSGTAMPSLSSSQVATVSLTCACAASIRRGSGGADRVFPRARVGWEIKLPQGALTLSPRRRGLSAVCVLALKNLTLWKEVEKSLKVEKSLSRAIRRTGQAQPPGDRTGRQRNIGEALRVQSPASVRRCVPVGLHGQSRTPRCERLSDARARALRGVDNEDLGP
jgi:hypothetical protein